MRIGDLCFFYHSNCKIPGIAGIAQIVKEGYVDRMSFLTYHALDTAFDKNHPYYDLKSDPENPKWFMVDVQYVRHLKRFIPLKELQSYKSAALKNLALVNRGRLSVQPVSEEDFDFILKLEDKEA
jgi:predicted RNA-binding protein with PUA-like domain